MAFEIPTIDVAPYVADPSSTAAADVVAAVRQACQTTGFFSLVGHGVPSTLQTRLLQAAEKLFALPAATKEALQPMPPLINRGYEMLGAQALQAGAAPDRKEGYFFGLDVPRDDPRAALHPLLVGANVYPAAAELPAGELRELVDAYYAAVMAVARTVLQILARGLPYGDDVFAGFARDPMCSLRLLHYPPAPEAPADDYPLGAGAHTDFGAITLLFQDTAGGLEVLDAATGAWVAVPPNPAAYVVNVGDMLSLWTNNAYRSNVHRVINRTARHRYSLPFFFDGNLDTSLAPLDGRAPPGGCPALTVEQHILQRLGQTYGRLPNEAEGGEAAGATTI